MRQFRPRVPFRVLFLCCLVGFCTLPAAATERAYLTLELDGVEVSRRAGEPESLGTRAQPGHPDEILVISHGSRALADLDPNTGLPRGRTRYEPLRIRKFVDSTSPLIAKALARGEIVNRAVLRLFRPGPGGAEQHFFTITLEIGRIVDYGTVMTTAADGSAQHVESVAFVFEKITWTFEPNGTEFTDDVRGDV